jgi:hypothetical protein
MTEIFLGGVLSLEYALREHLNALNAPLDRLSRVILLSLIK